MLDLATTAALVRAVLAELGDEVGNTALAAAPDDLAIFDTIDSFTVVELLLRTESEVERVTGRFVPLADERIFDADKSPLKRVDDWIAYVSAATADG